MLKLYFFRPLLLWMLVGGAMHLQAQPQARDLQLTDTDQPQTIWPAFEGGRVELTFHRWDLTAGDEWLYVFDGPSTAAPLLGIWGSETPHRLTASPWNPTGALTLLTVYSPPRMGSGWQATAQTACRTEIQRLRPLPAPQGQPDTVALRFATDGPLLWESSPDGQNFHPQPDWGSGQRVAIPADPPFRWVRARLPDCPAGTPALTPSLTPRHDAATPQLEKTAAATTQAAGCADCPNELVASTDLAVLCEGSCTFLNAEGRFVRTVGDDFNAGIDFSLWDNTNGITAQHCGSLDGSPTLWFGSDALPRVAETVALDARWGCNVGFDIRLGTDAVPNPTGCEDIEKPAENPMFQYFNGTDWVTLQVFDGGGQGNPGPWGSWSRVCIDLPPAARLPNLRLRWVQFEHDLRGFDQWAIDNVSIDVVSPTVDYQWTGPNILSGANTNRPAVCPTAPTTYTVTATDGVSVLTRTVFVDVITADQIAGRVTGDKTICPGGTTGTLTLVDYTGDVINWERQPGCTGNWEFIFVQSPTYAETNVQQTTCYRAIVQFGDCRGPSQPVRIEVPQPNPGRVVADYEEVPCESVFVTYRLVDYEGEVVSWFLSGSEMSGSRGLDEYIAGPHCPVTATVKVPGCPDSTARPAQSVCVSIDPVPPPSPKQGFILVQPYFPPECTGPEPRIARLLGLPPDWVEYWEILIPGSQGWQRIPDSENQTLIESDTVLSVGTCFRATVRLDTASNECDTLSSFQPPVNCVEERSCTNCVLNNQQVCADDAQPVRLCAPAGCDSLVAWQRAVTPIGTRCTDPSLNWLSQPVPPGDRCWDYNPPPNSQTCFRIVYAQGGDLNKLEEGAPGWVIRHPPIAAGTLAADPPEGCATSNGGLLTLSGFDPEAFIERWEYAEASDPNTWIPITGNFTPVQAYTGLTQTRTYRVRLVKDMDPDPTEEFFCENYSTPFTIQISPPTNPGVLVNNRDVCVGEPVGFISLRDQVGTIQRWEVSQGGCNGPWGLLTTTPITDFRPGVIPNDRCYRVFVKSGSCLEEATAPALVRVLNPPAGGAVAGTRTVCLGDPGPSLSLVGNTGWVLRWQSAPSCEAGPWTDIPGSENPTYSVPVLPQTTCFRAVLTNGACESFSTPGEVTVLPQTQPGLLMGNTEVCAGTPVDLTLTESRGTVDSWEWSDDGGQNWSTIPLKDTEYTTPPLFADRCYRGVFQSGSCPKAFSNVLCIDVEQPPGGELGPDRRICQGEDFGTVTLEAFTGAIIRWESSVNCNGVWDPLVGSAGTISRTFGALTQPLCVRVLLGGRLCPDAYTPPLRFDLDEPTIAGSLNSPPPLCAGQIPTVQLSGHRGQIVVWQVRPVGGSWTDVPNSSGSTVFPNEPVFQTVDIRVLVQNGPCPAQLTDAVRLEVVQPPAAGRINGPNFVCPGTEVQLVHVGPAAPLIRWERALGSCQSTTWQTFASNLPTVNAGSQTGAVCYRAVVAGTPPCAEVYSDSLLVEVHPEPFARGLIGNLEVCAATATPYLELPSAGRTGEIRRWQESRDGGQTWIDIEWTQPIYEPGPIDGPRLYRVEIGVADCPSFFTPPALVNLRPPTLGGRVVGEATVCRGQATGPLRLVEQRGRVLRWEASKMAPNDWFSLGKADLTELMTGRLTVDTWFRAIVQNEDCEIEAAQPVLIRVRESLASGVLTGEAEVCAERHRPQLILVANQRPVQGLEWRAADSDQWSLIPSTDWNLFFENTNFFIEKNTFFRIKFEVDGCNPTETSNEVEIRLYQPPIGGRVDGDHTVCRGAASSPLRLAGARGEVLGWDFHKAGSGWQPMGKAGLRELTSGRLTVRTGFRVWVGSGTCPPAVSEPAWVDVDVPPPLPVLTADRIQGCERLETTLRLQGPEPTAGRWQRSDTGTDWYDLPAAGTELPVALTDTAWFRFRLHPSACWAGERISNVLTLGVAETPLAGRAGDGAAICRGMGGVPLWAADYRGQVVRWEASKDRGQTWFSMGKAGQDRIASGRLTIETWFRPVIGNTGCPQEVSPAAVPVRVVNGSEAADLGRVAGPARSCSNEPVTLSWQPVAGVRLVGWRVEDGPQLIELPAAGTELTLPLTGPVAQIAAQVETACGLRLTAAQAVEVRVAPALELQTRSGCAGTGVLEVGPAGVWRQVRVLGTGGLSRQLSAEPFRVELPLGNYTVEAEDINGCRSSSGVRLEAGPPEGPAIVDVVPSQNQVFVRWATVPGPVEYRVAWRVVGALAWELSEPLAGHQLTLNGLQANSTYEVEVRVRCAGNPSGSTEVAGPRQAFRTTGGTGLGGRCADGSPWPQPTGFHIGRLGSNYVQVGWDTIPDAPGFIVSCGLADVVPANWPQWVVCQPQHHFVVGGLVPGRSYGIHVRTNCTNCTTALQSTDRRSAWSRRLDFTTPSQRLEKTTSDGGGLRLYPNPASTAFTLSWDVLTENMPILEVYDGLGRRVAVQALSGPVGELTVEVVDWPAGLYVLRAGTWRQTLLVVH